MTTFINNLLIALLLSSCAPSGQNENAIIESLVDGCFTLTGMQLDTSKEPVILRVIVSPENKKLDCPCKSALYKYTAFQERENETYNLMSGHFTTRGKETVLLPVSVQRQLIFSKNPVLINLACSGP